MTGTGVGGTGSRVRLYIPNPYRKVHQPHPKLSFIGGSLALFDHDDIPPHRRTCATCQDPLDLLVQLHVSETKQTLYVMGCNRSSCTTKLFEAPTSASSQRRLLCMGGGGSYLCFRSPEPSVLLDDVAEQRQESTVKSPWGEKSSGDDDVDDSEENEWGDDESTCDDTNLEEMLKQMGVSKNGSKSTSSQKKKKKRKSHSGEKVSCSSRFSCMEMTVMLEPGDRKQGQHNDDEDGFDAEDTVGTKGVGDSAKIQAMLAKYMEEEEDAAILNALNGTDRASNATAEPDERLAPADKAMLSFTDRIKRQPRQVLRYGGYSPIWSIPMEEEGIVEKQVPPCPSCGSARKYACQLVPPLLHVLEVDRFASSTANDDAVTLDKQLEEGGMNWGTIVVYACSCSGGTREEFVVVQKSVDDVPHVRGGGAADPMSVQAREYNKEEDDDDDFFSDDDDEEELGDLIADSA